MTVLRHERGAGDGQPDPAPPGVSGDWDWEALYRELGERVFRLAHRITGDEHTAADITQDTFIRVASRRHQFRGSGRLDGWIFAIARNLAREHVRRARTRVEGPMNESDPGLVRLATRPPDAELLMVVRATVARLPNDVRMVVLLHDVDGYTHAEIGRMLHIAAGSSRARLSRGRAQLRAWLAHAL